MGTHILVPVHWWPCHGLHDLDFSERSDSKMFEWKGFASKDNAHWSQNLWNEEGFEWGTLEEAVGGKAPVGSQI